MVVFLAIVIVLLGIKGCLDWFNVTLLKSSTELCVNVYGDRISLT